MKKSIWGIILLLCLCALGCGEEEKETGDDCDKATFKMRCNGSVLIFCEEGRVRATECAGQCASYNGNFGCYNFCSGPVGDVSYKCYSDYILLKNICFEGDNGAKIGGEEKIDCVGNTHCVSEGISAGCK